MTVLATIDDPAVIHRILTHLGLSLEAGEALPAARASLRSRTPDDRIGYPPPQRKASPPSPETTLRDP